jgi:hypothetical protein
MGLKTFQLNAKKKKHFWGSVIDKVQGVPTSSLRFQLGLFVVQTVSARGGAEKWQVRDWHF